MMMMMKFIFRIHVGHLCFVRVTKNMIIVQTCILVTGMTEALHDDPNQVIISHGVDDSYSRFILNSRDHILSLLFKKATIMTQYNENMNLKVIVYP